jgi:hypothetical protein
MGWVGWMGKRMLTSTIWLRCMLDTLKPSRDGVGWVDGETNGERRKRGWLTYGILEALSLYQAARPTKPNTLKPAQSPPRA